MKQIRAEFKEYDNKSSLNRNPNAVKTSVLQRITRKPIDNHLLNIPLNKILSYDDNDTNINKTQIVTKKNTKTEKVDRSINQNIVVNNVQNITKTDNQIKFTKEITKENDQDFVPMIYYSRLHGIEEKIITGIHLSSVTDSNTSGILFKFDINFDAFEQPYYMLNYKLTSSNNDHEILATIKKSSETNNITRTIEYSNLDFQSDYKITFTLVDIFENDGDETGKLLQEINIDLLPLLDFIPKGKVKLINTKQTKTYSQTVQKQETKTNNNSSSQKTNNNSSSQKNNNQKNTQKTTQSSSSSKKPMTVSSNLRY